MTPRDFADLHAPDWEAGSLLEDFDEVCRGRLAVLNSAGVLVAALKEIRRLRAPGVYT